MSLKVFLAIVTMALFGFHTSAQNDDAIRIGITKTDLSQVKQKKSSLISELLELDALKPNALNTISDKLVEVYTNDPKFVVVDFRSYDLVTAERERQKSEEFIDGYIIDQGKSEGVDKILSPIYLVQDDAISVRVIDVESGNLECAATTPLSKGKMGAKYARYYSGFLVQQLNERCFQIQFPVVRVTEEKKGNAKQILAAIGNVHHIDEKQKVGIYQTVVEKVGDQEFDRTVQVGEGVIEVIEGDHFSLVQVKKGGTEIATLLASSAPLFIKTIRTY